MAHGFVSYSKPSLGNFGKYLGDKIKSAANMAAEERKYVKEQAEKQRKEGVPEEEIKKPKKGYFFGKALSHEFGGDLLRRTKGTFSNDPSNTEDPALTKRQRFSNLMRGDVVTPQPFKQLELNLGNAGGSNKEINVEDKKLKSWLTVAFDGIEKSYNTIADKLSGLSKEEKDTGNEQTKTTKLITKVTSGLTTVKNFFNKNNKLKEEENKIESQQLEFSFNQANAEEMQQREAQIEKGNDLSSGTAYVDPYGNKDSKEDEGGRRSLLDRMMDFDTNRYGRPRKKGFKRRYARRKFNRFKRGLGRQTRRLRRTGIGRALRRFKLSEGGIAAPITEVQTPEAKNNIIPLSKTVEPKKITRLESNIKPQTKLARGGIVDNPTKTLLSPGQAVIPLNRNNPFKNIFQQQRQSQKTNKKDPAGKTMGDQLATALQLPAQAAGGLLLSTVSAVFKKLGGIGKVFAPFLSQLFRPLAAVFGLPATVIGSLLGGGPAAAATMDMKDVGDFLKGGGTSKKGKKSSGGGAPPPPSGDFGPGMTATGGSKASGNITSGFGQRSTGVAGASTNHGGIDIAGGAWVKGAPISVIKPGTVEATGDHGSSSWGKHVVVKHDDGSYSLYGHLDQINVRKGQKINSSGGAATVIGKLGSTGVSSGPHLHFELGTGWNGTITGKIDPAPYVDNYVRGGGNVTVDGTPMNIASPVSPKPGSNPLSPNGKPTSKQQTAANILLGGGSAPAAAAASTISPLGGVSGLGIFTSNPVAPQYTYRW